MIEKKIRLATHEEVEEKFKDIDDMTGATDSADGTHGFVPAPKAGDEKKALLGDGTWGIVDAIYSYKTEEEYNQAVANDEIPDGAKVIKEWDDNNELSGILVDSVMSDESVNPVQNKVAKKYMDDISLEISKLTNRMLICLPENTNGFDIFNPQNGFNVYSLVTNVNAPYEDSHGYFVMAIKNDYWVMQLWYDLYDAGEVFYRKCDISNNWTWSQFKKLTP